MKAWNLQATSDRTNVLADMPASTSSAEAMMERIAGCAQGQMPHGDCGNLWGPRNGDRPVVPEFPKEDFENMLHCRAMRGAVSGERGMEEREEVDSRRAALMNLLDGECRWESIRARVDYWIAVLLMWVALISSFVAGLGGLSGKFSPAVTGAIALVPATIALIATTLKFEAKSDWHYKKLYSLSAFRERLKFEMPLELTIEHLSAISRERRELIVELNKEWNKNLALDFSHLKGRKIP